jgi:hypothetical protein
MAGINCRCGEYFSTDSFPSEHGYRMFSESDYDEIKDPVTRRSLELLYLRSTKVYSCPKCKRLVVIKRENGSVDFYVKEQA